MPNTHDYTVRKWGHDFTFRPIDGGQKARISGWGHGLQDGDYLILPNDEGTSRYQIERVEYSVNPKDMWFADAVFAPRS